MTTRISSSLDTSLTKKAVRGFHTTQGTHGLSFLGFTFDRMKINQSDTAIQAFRSLPASHFTREESIVVKLLASPKTITQLCRMTGIEKSSMSRVLNTLFHKKQTILIAKDSPCPITGKTVHWYVLKDTQLKLF